MVFFVCPWPALLEFLDILVKARRRASWADPSNRERVMIRKSMDVHAKNIRGGDAFAAADTVAHATQESKTLQRETRGSILRGTRRRSDRPDVASCCRIVTARRILGQPGECRRGAAGHAENAFSVPSARINGEGCSLAVTSHSRLRHQAARELSSAKSVTFRIWRRECWSFRNCTAKALMRNVKSESTMVFAGKPP